MARVGWIDVCKGIGMVLVAAGHNRGLVRNLPGLMQSVYLFHVPLFFFLSGLTLKAEPKIAAIVRRVMRILLPYLVLTLLTAPFAWREFRQLTFSDFALGTLYGSGFTIGNIPLWFLPCLAVTLVMAMTVLRFVQGVMLGVVLVGLLVIGSALMSQLLPDHSRVIGWGSLAHSGGFWSVDVAPVAAAYVVAGHLFYAWLRRHDLASVGQGAGRRQTWLPGLMVLGLGSVWLAQHLGIRTDLNMRHYSPLPGATLAALGGVMAMMALAMWIDATSGLSRWLGKPLQWVGQSSLLVLGVHSYAMYTLGKVAVPVLGDKVWVWLVVLVMALAIPVAVDRWVIRRHVWLSHLLYPKF